MFVQCLAKDWDVNGRCDRRLEQKVKQDKISSKKRRKGRCNLILDEAEGNETDGSNDEIEETARETTENKIYESAITAHEIERHQGTSENNILSKLVSNLQRFYTLYYYMLYNFGFTFLFSLT